MKILFITYNLQAPASQMYWDALKALPNIVLYQEGMNIQDFDVALVMTYEHALVERIKQVSPRTKVGIIDPRSYKVFNSATKCDFLIIDSLEMEDYWRRAKIPLFRYSEYPNFKSMAKKHMHTDKIRIGYHGNKIHLSSMSDTITPALEELGERHNIELLVMYNGPPPTGEEKWYPKNISVKHVQWSADNYEKELSKCDIGIAPNKMPYIENPPYAHELKNEFNYSPDDYILRFKMPTNHGRIVVFGKLNIPVLSDFYPSALQILSEKRGVLCHSKDSWHYNLEKLIVDYDLRQTISNKLQAYIKDNLTFEKQNYDLMKFLGQVASR